ncbi:hypothetical protein ACWEKM_15575 [Streptomyces sp. NPDC004752]
MNPAPAAACTGSGRPRDALPCPGVTRHPPAFLARTGQPPPAARNEPVL